MRTIIPIAPFCLILLASCGNDGAKFSGNTSSEKSELVQGNDDLIREDVESPRGDPQNLNSDSMETQQNRNAGSADEDDSHSFSFFAPESSEKNLILQVDRINHEIRMNHEYEQINQVKNEKQVSRDRLVKSFTQGSSDGVWSDTINQSDSGIIDLLLVIDNSRSMLEEQLKVGSNLRMLLSDVTTADWKIKVVSTDTNDSCQGRIIQSSDLDPERGFYDAVLAVGIKGSSNEEGIRSAVQALECGDEWIRANSNLSILIVSDEDNCSNGRCENDPRSQAEYLKTLLETDLGGSKRVLGDDARIYGVIYKPGDFSCQEGGFMGKVYERLINDTNGKIGSICSPDYSEIFSQISYDIRSTLKASFVLDHQPRLDTMKVLVNGKKMDRGHHFEIVKNSLVFKDPPPARAKIEIKYSFPREPMYDRFDVGEQIGTIQSVRIELEDGTREQLESEDFSIQGTEIEFKNMPQERAKIIVDYRKNFPTLKNQFHLSERMLAGSLRVSVEGEDAAYIFNPETSTVSLLRQALDGQSISFNYVDAIDRGPKYAYRFSGNTESVYGLKAHDKITGKEIPIEEISDGVVQFFESDYVDQRSIMLEYFTHDYSQESIVLPPCMRLDHFSIFIANNDSNKWHECLDYKLDPKIRELQIDCQIGSADTVKIDYMGIDPDTLNYRIDIEDPESYEWSVTVDDQEYESFERIGNHVRFDPSIRSKAKISIHLSPKR